MTIRPYFARVLLSAGIAFFTLFLLLAVASSATAQQVCVEDSRTVCPLADDDLIVLSTDPGSPGSTALGGPSGQANTLQNGASNETIFFEGTFGDDTIMNFTTQGGN